MQVIALDLEGTLVSNAVSQIARAGLYEFLQECRNLCSRIVIFTSVQEALFYQIATTLAEEKFAPAWFQDIEYIHWSGTLKDLRFIKDADPDQCVLVDDFCGYICQEQMSRWIEIKQFSHPYREDGELKIVLQKLKLYV